MISKMKGFTLVELMVVVIVVGVLAAIILPSYQSYVRKAEENTAQQEIQKIMRDLEQQKSRQFNYLGYSLPADPYYLPLGAAAGSAQYTIEVRDGDETGKLLNAASNTPAGKNWVIRALSADGRRYSFLIDSKGLSCKNRTAANITFTACGTGGEEWKLQ